MAHILPEAKESRKNELINKLITFGVYKKNQTHLFELSLDELEKEYKSLFSKNHPHCGMGSLIFRKK